MTISDFVYTPDMAERITYVPVEWIMQNVGESIDFPGDDEWIRTMISYKAPYAADHVATIMERGFQIPIVIQSFEWQGGTFRMGNGHHRLTSAILLCLPEVPVFFSIDGDYMRTDVSTGSDLDCSDTDIHWLITNALDYP